jgi:hypothetical protein
MNRDYEDLLPRYSRATVTVREGHFRIDLPAPGFHSSRDRGGLIAVAILVPVVISCLGLGLGTLILMELVGEPPPGADARPVGELCGQFTLIGVGILGMGLWYFGQATRRTRITIAEKELTIETAGVFSRKVRTWPVKDVLAVGAWRGLWVSACDGKHVFLKERRDDEIGWVADVLQAELRVTDQTPPEDDEVAVRYDTLNVEGVPGLLRVEPGQIVVEHGFAREKGYCFRPRRWAGVLPPAPVAAGTTVLVSPEDLTCRPEEGGGSCLEIRTTGKKPRLVLWSDDPEALPRAVATFWGSDLEEPEWE